MQNNMLSIMIPAAPGSEARLRSLLSRITLAKKTTPEYDIEIIVCDGGSSDDSKDLCEFISKFIPLKYIYIPIHKYVDPSYPVNAMVRVSEGHYLCYMSVDYWPSEYFLNVIGGLGGLDPIGVALGSVYRDSAIDLHNEKLPMQLLHEGNAGCAFSDVIKEMKILRESCNGPMWAATREFVLSFEGFYRDMWGDMQAKVGDVDEFDIARCLDFEAINVWHEEKEKGIVPPIVGRQGKLTEYSFSIINGVSREPEEHEIWIRDNVSDVQSYELDSVGEI